MRQGPVTDLLGEVRQVTAPLWFPACVPFFQLRSKHDPFSLGQLESWKRQAGAARVKLRTAVSRSNDVSS